MNVMQYWYIIPQEAMEAFLKEGIQAIHMVDKANRM